MGRTRIAWRAPAAGVLAATALLATGCGSLPKPLTRAELTGKANAICRDATARFEAATKGQNTNTPQQIERLAAKLSGFEQTALAKLAKLVPPTELEADWKRFVAGAEMLVENTAKVGEYVASKNRVALKALIASTEATQREMAATAKRDRIYGCQKID
jgi:hypothetical protein